MFLFLLLAAFVRTFVLFFPVAMPCSDLKASSEATIIIISQSTCSWFGFGCGPRTPSKMENCDEPWLSPITDHLNMIKNMWPTHSVHIKDSPPTLWEISRILSRPSEQQCSVSSPFLTFDMNHFSYRQGGFTLKAQCCVCLCECACMCVCL